MEQPHIKQCFLNVSMSNRFDGLQEIARRAGIKLNELTPQSYLIFVNNKRDKIAMLVGPQHNKVQQTMAYVKLERNRTADLRVISEIPRYFDGKKINYDQALEAALTKAINRKNHKIIEQLKPS